jgi:hypothetical protein
MRKKLIALAFALAAVAASTIPSTASAAPNCPAGTWPIACGHRTICCPDGAFCVC